MRKTVATFFMSPDGVVEAPEEWHFPYFTGRDRRGHRALTSPARRVAHHI